MLYGGLAIHQAGAAAVIPESCAEFGGVLGIAVLGGVATAVYRLAMNHSSQDAGATDILAGAIEQAKLDGGQVRLALREASCAAFVQGLRATAAACVLVRGVAAIVLVLPELKQERIV